MSVSLFAHTMRPDCANYNIGTLNIGITMGKHNKHRNWNESQENTTMSTPPVTPPVTPPEDIGQATEQVIADVQSDITATENAVQGGVAPLWQQARAEYDSLAPAAQGRIHQLLNDLEALGTALPAMHTVFGAKK